MKKITLVIAVLTLCAGLAMPETTTYKAAGNLPGAEFHDYRDGYPVDAGVYPVSPTDNGPLAYLVYWNVRWPLSEGSADFYELQVWGLAPAAAVKSQGSKLVSVDVDIPMLTQDPSMDYLARVWKCTGVGTPSYSCDLEQAPVSAPLKGTFTSNLGSPGSWASSNIGTIERSEFWEGGFWKEIINGQLTEGSCVFSGVIGAAVLTAPSSGYCRIQVIQGKGTYTYSN